MSSFFSNKFSLFFRNNLNIRPNGYNYIKSELISISDFFFWNTSNGYDTKINITNLASQVLPNINQSCDVDFFFYDAKGKLILTEQINLEYFQSYNFQISKKIPNKYGSLAIFHKFKNNAELREHGSYVTEKGYLGYNYNGGPWNYVHGNNSSLAITNKNTILPLLSSTLIQNNSYIPQVRFDDCNYSSLIFNNPLNKNLKTTIELFDKNWIKVDTIKIITESMNTNIISLGEQKKSYVKIKSNMLLFRPIIFKKYETYFDIFHG